MIGHDGTTTETELRKAGRRLLGRAFGGVLAADEEPRGRRYFLFNTLARGTGGEHWYALAPDGDAYDSLRRNGALMDAEQSEEETNCGQRALAWCCLHSKDAGLARLL